MKRSRGAVRKGRPSGRGKGVRRATPADPPSGAPIPAIAAPRIETRPLADLKPSPWNPRVIDEHAAAGLGRSLTRFGLVEPLIWNRRTGHVVGGHQRLELLRKRGVAEVSVSVVDLPVREEKALCLALNNRAAQGRFEPGALEEILAELRAEAPDAVADLLLEEILAGDAGPPSTEDADPAEPVEIKPLPTFAWALIGLPLERWGEIREKIRALEAVPGALVKTIVNDAQ